MPKFNNGKAYHGSESIMNGGLKGSTDTDYFYFFCPKCTDQEIMRVLDYEIRAEQPKKPYNAELSPKAAKGFTLAFKVYCQKCEHTDFVKISNMGWQGGKYSEVFR